VVNDALSHKFSEETPLFASLSSLVLDLISTLYQCFATSKIGKEILRKFQIDDSLKEVYTITNGLLYYKDIIFLIDYSNLRKILFFKPIHD